MPQDHDKGDTSQKQHGGDEIEVGGEIAAEKEKTYCGNANDLGNKEGPHQAIPLVAVEFELGKRYCHCKQIERRNRRDHGVRGEVNSQR